QNNTTQAKKRNRPGRSACQRCGGQRRPLEPELRENVPAVQHPVPAGMSDERRQNDRAHAFRDGVAEEKLQRGNEQDQDEKLAKLDANVEGKQGRQQVGPGELQRFTQSKRETKSVYQAEAEGHHPAALQAAATNNVLSAI